MNTVFLTGSSGDLRHLKIELERCSEIEVVCLSRDRKIKNLSIGV